MNTTTIAYQIDRVHISADARRYTTKSALPYPGQRFRTGSRACKQILRCIEMGCKITVTPLERTAA